MASDTPTRIRPGGPRLGEPDREIWARVRPRSDLSAPTIASRFGAVVLWLLVFSSAASGLLALARVQARARGPLAVSSEPAGLEGFAELAVSAFLEGSDAAVRTLYSTVPPPSVAGLGRPNDRFIARAASVRVRPAGRDAWRVTVGAEVLVAAEGGYRRDGIHWFELDVARRGDGYAATSLPNEVLGPAGLPDASDSR
jgi:hypothetical protein